MKKNFKRWLALTLAVIMVISTCMVSSDNFLRATDEAATVAEDSGAVVDETEVGSDAVTPDTGETEPVVEAPAEEPQEIVIPPQEQVPEGAAPETPAEEPGDVALGQEVDVIPSENAEDIYNVVFYRPAVEGGTLRVWTDGSDKKDVTYTDGKYVEEVKEGTTLYFEIETTGNYLVDSVKDQNGAEIAPTTVNGNVSSYSMVVNENKELTIMYKEVPQEESDEVEEEEAPAEEEELSKAPMSRAADKIINVGDKITLSGEENAFRYCEYAHKWTLDSSGIATLSGDGNTATVTGKSKGTVTITHTYCDQKKWHFNENHNTTQENFTVEVIDSETDPQPEGTERVYIYMKMDPNKIPDGWEKNQDGWYTIGYVDVPGIPPASNYDWDTLQLQHQEKVMAAISSGGVVRFPGHANLALDLNAILWNGSFGGETVGLRTAQGAAGYDTSTTLTWHLNGWLEVKETAEITIKGNTDTKTYNGVSQSVNGYTVEYADGVNSDDISVELKDDNLAKASGTNVGTYYMNLTRDDFEVTSDRYNLVKVNVVDGWLEITPITDPQTIIITGHSKTVTYNGKEQTVTDYDVQYPEGLSEKDIQVSLKTGLEAKASGTDAGTYNMGLTKDSFTVTSKNYPNIEVIVNDGSLTINPRNVTLTSATDTKEYDGTPLTNDTVTVDGEGFVGEEGATFNVTGSQTIPGTGKNSFTWDLKKGTKAGNYTITTEEGKLIVTNLPDDKKLEVTVTPNSGTEKYDGTGKSVSGFVNEGENGIPVTANGLTYYVTGLTAGANGTDARTYEVEVTGDAVVTDAAGNNVTSEFKVKVEKASLEIEKRDVTLTSGTAKKEYDGTPLTKKEVTVGGDEFAEGEGATYDVTGSQTVPTTSNNTFEYTLNEGTKAENYNITKNYGTLTVTTRNAKYEITVEANSLTDTYDGTEKSVSGFKTLEFEVNGQTYTVSGLTASATGTDAGETPVNVTGTAKVTDKDGNDVSSEFAVETKNGRLVIEKRKVTLTSATDSKKYDGTALTNKRVDVSGDGFARNEGATYNVTGTRTVVGKTDNEFTYDLNGNTKAGNYDIKQQFGTLEVKDLEDNEKFEITVEANSNTGNIYDGDAKTAEGLKTTTFTVNKQTYTVEGLSAKRTETNAGTYDVEVTGTAVVKDAAENDVTDQFKVKRENGKLAIAKKNVTVTANEKEREYGVENPELDYTVEGMILPETLEEVTTVPELSTEAEITSPRGNYDITFAKDTSDAENYTISYVNNTLTIKPNTTAIVIKAADDRRVYNGESLENNEVEMTGKLVEDDYIDSVEMTRESTITNVGTQQNVIKSIVIKNVAGDDVTSNYANITLQNGTLEITKATIEVSAVDNGKVVGQEDPTLTYIVKTDSSVDGEQAAFSGNVARKTGEDVNEYVIGAGDVRLVDNDRFLADNYELQFTEGIFEIVPADYEVVKTLTMGGSNEDGTFKVGETATFDITVKNNSSYVVKNVVVKDILRGTDGTVIILPGAYTVNGDTATIEELQAGGSVVVKAKYTVTQSDIDNQNEITNIATAESTGTTPEESGEVEVPVEKEHPEFTAAKILTNKHTVENGKFKVGDTATFDITVQNTGNVTLNNVTVTEQLEGAVINAGTGYSVTDNVAVINKLEVGETVVVKAEYKITQEDVDNGGTKNAVTVEGEGAGTTDPDPEEPETEIPTDDKNPAAVTTKTLTNAGTGENGSFKAGETATFNITVENTGNVTLKEVTVEEQLEGAKIVAGEGYTVSEDGKTATITRIGVGETVKVKAVYTVTQADVDNGGVTNSVDVKIPDKDDPQSPTEEIPTDTHTPEFTSTKELTNEGTGEQGTFKVGETATFDITVKNTGNVTLNDVEVAEGLEGATIVAGDGYSVRLDGTALIDTLEVGAEVVVKAEYTITQEDIDNGGTSNTVTVEGKGPGTTDPEPEEPGTGIPTETPDPSMNVQKTVTSANELYRVGDTITYQIAVENDGNTTLHNVVVDDILQNAAGEVTFEEMAGVTFDGNTATIATMAPGEVITLNCSYVVTRADAGNEIINSAIGDSDETDPTDPSTTDPTDTEDLYNLTINYVYAAGGTAAASVNVQYLEGETFGFTSPTIAGYTPDYAFVRSDANGMPARDLEFTVTYTANAAPAVVTPVTPVTPGVVTPPVVPGAPALVPAPDAPVPGAMLVATDDGDVEVVPVVDEEVPLANRDLDEHECCILHFLLMLAAILTLAGYTHSMKKRQKRIAELAEELETELLKREQEKAE